MLPKICKFLQSEDGPTSVEYAIMLAMILMAVIGSITFIGMLTQGSFNFSKTEIERTFPDLGV
ncbi:Flp family type IVb pilin [Bremerella cremea]|uniref:Flp family type IVb pilin n=1 Tax=Blastopirellula marina TaxID=124 RepID=A0A2S8FVD9_9BACT|nr:MULTISPECIES: Flp family type IVb pilin [Pirellulaceae]PQO36152.1 Flp family type IVb pilin [Blastopirellula marina]RCS48829.1 Flp family type IVb pilin [Bremerella cremea]